jgi:hypothetical protein
LTKRLADRTQVRAPRTLLRNRIPQLLQFRFKLRCAAPRREELQQLSVHPEDSGTLDFERTGIALVFGILARQFQEALLKLGRAVGVGRLSVVSVGDPVAKRGKGG